MWSSDWRNRTAVTHCNHWFSRKVWKRQCFHESINIPNPLHEPTFDWVAADLSCLRKSNEWNWSYLGVSSRVHEAEIWRTRYTKVKLPARILCHPMPWCIPTLHSILNLETSQKCGIINLQLVLIVDPGDSVFRTMSSCLYVVAKWMGAPAPLSCVTKYGSVAMILASCSGSPNLAQL